MKTWKLVWWLFKRSWLFREPITPKLMAELNEWYAQWDYKTNQEPYLQEVRDRFTEIVNYKPIKTDGLVIAEGYGISLDHCSIGDDNIPTGMSREVLDEGEI
jgi:hypothetical protein